jgi:hypothetical protein
VGDAATSKSGSNSVGSRGSGPDVLGLRIGMTPAEARPIIKSRVLVSANLQKNYIEGKSTLSFVRPSSVSLQPVPNGEFLGQLYVRGRTDENEQKELQVILGPVPSHEEIVGVYRSEEFLPSKRPTFDAFEKALLEK